MTVIARPAHPVRLAGVFLASLAAFALVAAAAGAVMYILDNERGGSTAIAPHADVDLPPGMVLVRPIEGESQWRDALAFSPIIPETLPASVDASPLYFLQQPDARGRQAGHVRFASQGGPTIILVEQQGELTQESPLRTQESPGTRAYLEAFACGTIVLQTQLYFSLDAESLPPRAETVAVAQKFSDDLHEQCAG